MSRSTGLRLLLGELRGRRLEVASGVRPTESRVREALFSIWRQRIPDAAFLDLFAGSGAVGLEAWSLGAERVAFVEAAPRVLAALVRNVEELPRERFEIVRGRLPEVLRKRPSGPFDLAFADPPYDFTGYSALVEATVGRMHEVGEIAVEHSVRAELADEVAGWRCRDSRRYGESVLSFYGRGGSMHPKELVPDPEGVVQQSPGQAERSPG